MKTYNTKRYIQHIFALKNWLFGADHFLAMFPSTVLAPIIINNKVGFNLLDISLVIFSSAFGTLIYIITSKGKIPAYLGSAYTYIGLTLYIMDNNQGDKYAFVYVGWSYAVAGILLILLSFLYKYKNAQKKFSSILPPAIVGPSISLIGLELSSIAISDAGIDIASNNYDLLSLITALVTLVLIIVFSVTRMKITRKAPILFGLFGGYILWAVFNGFPSIDTTVIFRGLHFQSPLFELPQNFFVPQNFLRIIIAVFPPTLLIFSQNFSRIAVINQLRNPNSGIYNKGSFNTYQTSARCQGFSIIGNALVGSIPTAIYAENIAIMSLWKEEVDDPDSIVSAINSRFSIVPIFYAMLYAILSSTLWPLHQILMQIPKPVIGGVELFVFSLIAAPGLMQIVDSKVNYKKLSNQLLSASVFIAGISGLSVDILHVELKGMSLGLCVGILVNILFLALYKLGFLDEQKSTLEIVSICLKKVNNKTVLLGNPIQLNPVNKHIEAADLQKLIENEESQIIIEENVYQREMALDLIEDAKEIQVLIKDSLVFRLIKAQTYRRLLIPSNAITAERKKELYNDFTGFVNITEDDELSVDLEKISLRLLKKFVQNIECCIDNGE